MAKFQIDDDGAPGHSKRAVRLFRDTVIRRPFAKTAGEKDDKSDDGPGGGEPVPAGTKFNFVMSAAATQGDNVATRPV